MNKKIVLCLALTLLLTTIGTAATLNVPGSYPNIKAAITAASSGDVIVIADGTYTGANNKDLDFGGKNLLIQSASGNPLNCIINCQGTGRGFYFHSGETEDSSIYGITIMNGSANSTTAGGPYGGAIECMGASPTIDNCIIKNSSATYGGAIDCFNASPLIQNCYITGNNSTYDGSAIECGSDAAPQIFNCLFASNTADGYGTIDSYDNSNPEIINCTITGNSGASNVGGIYSSDSGATIRNTILWNNGDDIFGMGIVSSYSCIQDGDSGVGNINSDPMFRTGPLGSYYLSQTYAGQLADSNCVNAGQEFVPQSIYGLSNSYTTQTDEVEDQGIHNKVDIGFHYPKSGAIIPNFILTTNVTGAGSVTKTPNNPNYKQFSEVRLDAIPAAGHRFEKWRDANTATPGDYNETPGPDIVYVVTMNANRTVTAYFSSAATFKLTTYAIGNGSIFGVDPNYYPDPEDPRVYYIPQDPCTVTITAAPNVGYVVKRWLKGNTATFDANNPDTFEELASTNPLSTTIDANTTIAVEFKYQQYLLTTNVYGGNGSILPKRGYYLAGTTVQLAANPNNGYRVKKWGGHAKNQPAWNVPTNTVVMNAPKDVNVAFEVSTNRLIHVFGDVNGIQSAINQADNGDTIQIHPGTYIGTDFVIDDVTNKSITIVGDPENPENVVIDCKGQGNGGFAILSNSRCVLNGITIKNAGFTDGSGTDAKGPYFPGGNGGHNGGDALYLANGSHEILNCRISQVYTRGGDGGNGADANSSIPSGSYGGEGGWAIGAGIFIENGSPVIKNTIIEDCCAVGGNGGNGGNGKDSPPPDPNVGPGGQGGLGGAAYGGGIACWNGSSPTFENCIIRNCHAIGGLGGNGGNSGRGFAGAYGGLTTETSAWNKYRDDLKGWGLSSANHPNLGVSFTNDPFQAGNSNTVDIADYSTYGGGVYVGRNCLAKFINCTISDNTTEGTISGLGGNSWNGVQQLPRNNFHLPSYGSGVFCDANSSVEFGACNVNNNEVRVTDNRETVLAEDDDYGGGSISYRYAIWTNINDCNIFDNFAPVGGGVYSLGCDDIHINDSNISNNHSYSGGGVLTIDSFGYIHNSIVKGNTAGTVLDANQQTDYALYGSGGGIYALSSLIDINDTIVTENSAGATGGGICFDGDWWTPPYTQPIIKNCLITKNSAADNGGGIAAIYFAAPTIQNCTIVQNHTTNVNSNGSGLYASYLADVIVKDSILWENGFGNNGVAGSQIALSSGGPYTDMPASVNISYSDIQTSAEDINKPMDVVILIDTTGSMGSVLDSVKTAAGDIVDRIAQKTSDYRIGVVNFRDYPLEPYGSPGIDYTFHDDLEFVSSRTAVQNAINGITLGFGGDAPEAVYSGLMHCIDGNSLGYWRTGADVKKLIILMGDAPGHDPYEPYGNNYSLSDVVAAANNKNIKIYSILTGSGVGNNAATNDFNSLAQGTNGTLIETPDGNSASAAVIQAIDLATLPSTYVYLDDPLCSIVGLAQDINGKWSVQGSSNISADPNFVSGYYLSQTASENDIDSVCVNAGSASALSLGMNTYTTMVNGGLDSGIVDMGYHYQSALPQYDVIVKIVEDANLPGIHGSITADPPTLISYNPATATYNYKFYKGTIPVLTAVPNASYFVRGWYDNNDVKISVGNSLTFVADSNATYFVRFKQGRIVSVSGGGDNLRTAVQNAENGDSLIVAAGIYNGDIDIGGKQIKLFGVKPDNQGVIDKTVINCTNNLRGFVFSGGETNQTVLNGFTIINGGGDVNDIVRGGGIFIDTNSSPLIVNVDISDCNVSNANGGAVYIGALSNPEFRKVTITNCRAQDGSGGGVYVSNNSNPIFTDCTFSSCLAGLRGGAICSSTQDTLAISDCTFSSNTATTSAGAIYFGELCDINLEGCTFSNNSADESGGAIMYSTDCGFNIKSCNFTANGSNNLAGGIYISENCSGTIEDTNMTSNTATDDGGAIYIVDSNMININDCQLEQNTALRGGGIFALSSPKVTIMDCNITANRAYGSATYRTDPNDPNTLILDENFIAQGGGIYAFSSIEKIAGCDIANNTAITSGGGIYIGGELNDANSPQIFNTLITKNKAGADGGGISVNWFANVNIQNCTVAENSVTNMNGNGGGLYCSYGAQTDVKDTIFWTNTGIDGSQIAVASGDTAYPIPGTVNITYSDVDLRTEAAFNSLNIGSGTSSIANSGSVLVDGQTIYSAISSTGSAKVIVSLAEPANKYQIMDWSNNTLIEPLKAEIASRENQVISTLSANEFTLRHKLVNVATFSGTITQSGLDKLLANSMVEHIEPVRIAYPMLAQAIPMGNALNTRPTYNGSGNAIAIVDTGIDYTHPRLGGTSFPNNKTIGGFDTGDNDNNPMPIEGTIYPNGYGIGAHGTNCAGIAAGMLGTVGDYIGGVAYNAKLYALKVTSNSDPGQGFPSDATLAAWDWCITHQKDNPANPIRVISNSWGYYNYPINSSVQADAFSPAHTRAAQTAVNAGITILAASGNDGFAGQGISWPSAMSNIISVGAVYDTTGQVTSYSNTANILDILAPADPVYTTDLMGNLGYDGDYFPSFNGTSSATPFAAGCVAALQSAAVKNIGTPLSPQQIRNFLKYTGTPVTDTKVAITKPLVNLGAAIALLSKSTPINVEAGGCILTGYVKDVNTWTPVTAGHNYDDDPNFVFGYYLSHIAAGQDYNSPFFDKGSATAAALGLNTFTSRTDGNNDIGLVNLGYHYSHGVKRYNLHIDVDTADANGTTDPIPGDYNEYEGTTVKIEAIPDANSRVAMWIIDDTNIVTNNRFQDILMDRAHDVTVVFEFYTPKNLIVPDQYTTIQGAIDAAEDGDTIYIYRKADGKPHFVSDPCGLDFKGKAITIRSENPNDANIVAATIIDCNGNGRAFIFHNGEKTNSIIDGLTINNGLAAGEIATGTTIIYDPCDANIYYQNGIDADGDGFGGAIYVDANTSPTIRNCVFNGCQVTGGQGSDGARGFNLITDDQRDRGGRGGNGGDGVGNGFGGIIFCDKNSEPNIFNCSFNDSIARGGIGGNGGNGGNGNTSKIGGDGGWGGNGSGNGYGGAIYCSEGSKPKIAGCTFSKNIATSGIGGDRGLQGPGNIPKDPPFAYDGIAGTPNGTGFGGVIYYEEGASADINDCKFFDNTAAAVRNDSGSGGGAIYFEPNCADIKLVKSNLAGNEAAAGSGGAVSLGAKNIAVFAGCYFGGNIANANGGALAVGSDNNSKTTKLDFDNCAFTGNLARNWGGGIYAKNTSADINDCFINRNTADSGGGLHFVAQSTLKIIGGTIIQNKAIGDEAQGGGALIMHLPATIINCQIMDNRSNYSGGGISFKGPETADSNVINCLFVKNSALARGGAIETTLDSSPVITSCTFSENETDIGGSGSGVFCTYNSSPTIKYCIFDKNKRVAIYENNIDSDPVISYCFFNANFNGDFFDFDSGLYDTYNASNPNIELTALNAHTAGHNLRGKSAGEKNVLDVDAPVFRSGSLGDYYLKQTGAYPGDVNIPAIDAGDVDAVDVRVTSDSNMSHYTTRVDSNQPDNPLHSTYDQGKLDLGFHYIDASHAQRFYLTTAVIGDNGNIEPPSGYFFAGTTIPLTALPNTGWRVNKWLGTDDDSTSSASNFVVLICDKTVTVSFEQPKNLYVPAGYSSLQEAINDAKDGDKVIIAQGTYYGNENNYNWARTMINGRSITITGTNPDDPCIVAHTVIYGNGFELYNSDIIMDGITIQDAHYYADDIEDCGQEGAHGPSGDGFNGFPIFGGSMAIVNSSPIIRNVRFVRCSATAGLGCDGKGDLGDGGWGAYAWGGAAAIDSTSNPVFKNCQFIDCYVLGSNGMNGGGKWGHAGSWGDPNDNPFQGWDFGPYNKPSYYSGHGGAIYVMGGSKAEFEKCLFQGNRAYSGVSGISGSKRISGYPNEHYVLDSFGGAVFLAAGSEAKFTDCNFVNNTADTRDQIDDGNELITYDTLDWVLYDPVVSYGGAICAEGTATPIIKNCTFTNNAACAGGSMYWEDSIAHISLSSFNGNDAMLGGAILLVDSNSSVYDCSFSGNTAVTPAGQGGAVYSASSASKFYDCKFMDNIAQSSGGGVYFSGGLDPNLHNCLFVNNNAYRDGGAVSSNWDTQLSISNCTMANNYATGDNFADSYGGGVSCAYNAYTNIINSIFWNNDAEYGSEISIGSNFDAADKRVAEVNVAYCDVKDGATGVFVDYEHGCILKGYDAQDPNDITNLEGTSYTSPEFRNGYFGGYYLSAKDANDPCNQDTNSPCIDAGLGTALSNDMYRHTTRTDHKLDAPASNVDMGYHYTLTSEIEGDFNFDGKVDLIDLGLFMEPYWMQDNCKFPYYCHERDLSEDGEVDFEDFALFAENYMMTEKIPPYPHKMTWDIKPHSISPTSISMKATKAKDNSGSRVWYYFDCISGGGHDSGWVDPCTYTDSSLVTNVQYGYRIKAKDAQGNETQWSDICYAVAGEDATAPTPSPMRWLAVPHATSSSIISMEAVDANDISGVEYLFEEISDNNGATDSGWISTKTYVDSNLDPNTIYTYRAKARDKSENQNETLFSISFSVKTPAIGGVPGGDPNVDTTPPTPNQSQWLVTPFYSYDGVFYYHSMTAVTATDTASPPVEYKFVCINGGGISSGWQLSPEYTTGRMFAPNHGTYIVYTRDSAVPIPNETVGSVGWNTYSGQQ